ncbi:helix-turn-helix domain-containing protein [Flagellimonas flava]|uniref:helix-turn-helix domain-containing protein n=1 Tax=Flagellimonas flava TaxID=570519 RepID=UPI003D65D347
MEHLSAVRFDIWSVLLLFGILQGLFLGMLLLIGSTRRKSKYYLIALVAVVTINLLNYVIINSSLHLNVPHLVNVSLPLLFLLGPLFLFYVKSVLSEGFGFRATDLLHGLPFLLALLSMAPFFMLSGPAKIQLIESQIISGQQGLDLGTTIFTVAQIAQSFIYVVLALNLLNKSSQESKMKKDTFRLEWLRKITFGFLLFWLVDFLAVVWFLQQGHMDVKAYYLSLFCCTLFIHFMVVLTIRNRKVYTEVLLNNPRVKYKSSKLVESDLKKHISQIIIYMEDEKPYLLHDLNLSKLSENLGIPKHVISQILNEELGKTFYEFLNEYRYKEVRSRLTNPKYNHLTILAIALDAGFSNKNTFNKAFKKFSGITPSQFLKSTANAKV